MKELLFFLFLLLSIHLCKEDEPFVNIPKTFLEKFTPNKGYISSKNTISNLKCFNFIKSKLSDTGHSCNLIYFPIEFEHVCHNLGLISVEDNIHYKLQDSVTKRYLNTIIDDDYSFSYSYLSVISLYAYADYNESANLLLSEEGKKIYDNGNNSDFFNQCGDYLITKFAVGMYLVYSVRIEFMTSKEKSSFYNAHSQHDFTAFKDFFHQLKKYLYSMHMSNVKIELYAIQIGGRINNDVVNTAMRNNFLVTTCTLETIEECDKYSDDLETYFKNDFYNQKEEKFNRVPLEEFSVIRYGKNSNAFSIKSSIDVSITKNQSRLTKRMVQVNYLIKQLKHIKSSYPIEVKEINSFLETLQKYYEQLLFNNSVANCYQDFDNISECTETLLTKIIDYNKYIRELKSFFDEFNFEDVFEITFRDNLCLPNHLRWVSSGNFQARRFRREYYIVTDFGIFCKKFDKYNFICSDGIVEFNMKIEDMLNESEKTFICKNTQFGISFEHFVFGSAVKERNLFYLNLDNINEI